LIGTDDICDGVGQDVKKNKDLILIKYQTPPKNKHDVFVYQKPRLYPIRTYYSIEF